MRHLSYPWLNEQPVLLLMLCILIRGRKTDGCATVPRTDGLSPIEQLVAAVKEAESRMENDAIILPKAPAEPLQVILPEGLVANRMKPPPAKPVAEQDLPEIRIGTMASFSCSHQRSGPNTSDTPMLWRHHKTKIYTNTTTPVSSGSFFYSYSRVRTQSFFFVHNVTADAAGPVQCLQRCEAGWCVVQDFQLRPQLRAKDVFYGSLQNTSSQCGGQISHTCRVRINCTPGVLEGKHYIWKLDDTLVGVPWDHGYLDKVGLYQGVRLMQQRGKPYPPGVARIKIAAACSQSKETGAGFYEEVLTITLEMSSWCLRPSARRVQCWFRPYATGRRWLVQSAYAHY